MLIDIEQLAQQYNPYDYISHTYMYEIKVYIDYYDSMETIYYETVRPIMKYINNEDSCRENIENIVEFCDRLSLGDTATIYEDNHSTIRVTKVPKDHKEFCVEN